jgi:predicted PurR-regulated permease PerM
MTDMKDTEKVFNLNISTRTILKVLVVTALFVALVFGIYITRHVLTWVLMAFALSLAINPAVSWFSKKIPGHSRVISTLLVFLILLVAFALLALLLFPPVAGQTGQLFHNVPGYTRDLSRPGTFTGDFVNRFDLIRKIQDSQSEVISRLTSASGSFVSIVVGVFSSLIAVLSILGLTFFMLMEGPAWIKAIWEIVPDDRRRHAQRLTNEMYQAMVGYVNGKLLAAFLAGLSAGILLAILHVPYAAALALVVALLSIIPMFGATVAAVIVVLVCLFTSTTAAIVMGIFFFVYQQVENNIIQPVIFKHTVDVSPLLVFVSVLVGTAAAGILGALIAIPVTASIQILVRDFYSRRHLDPPHVEQPAEN